MVEIPSEWMDEHDSHDDTPDRDRFSNDGTPRVVPLIEDAVTPMDAEQRSKGWPLDN